MNLADLSNYTIQKEKERVLLLSMSVLSYRNLKQNTYVWKDKKRTWYFKGVSQLEPDSKLIMSLLADQGTALDKVIILATKESREKKNSAGELDKNGVSAVEFYEHRIKSFLGEKRDKIYDDEDKETYDENAQYSEHRFSNVKIPKFHVIELELEDYLQKVLDAIQLEENKDIELYLDLQGGNRAIITKMDAVLKLLTVRGVQVEGRYNNLFTYDHHGPYDIREASDEYTTSNLVTAMETFRNYGRGDELMAYFDSRNDEVAKELSAIIRNASDAIQLCKVDAFDQAIKEVKNLSERVERKEILFTDPLAKIVYEQIQEDYRDLIHAALPYVEQIRWCLKKKYYQQALTILEAQMPTQYVTAGLVFYCKDAQKKEDVLQHFEDLYITEKNSNSSNLYKFKDLNHYFFCDYIYGSTRNQHSSQFDPPYVYYGDGDDSFRQQVIKNIDQYRKIKRQRNNINHVARFNEGGYFTRMKGKYPDDRNWRLNTQETEQLITSMEKYLKDFERLVKQVPSSIRNNILDLA